MFFAIPVLHGILPQQYLSHFALLVAALHLLNSDYITQVDLQNARSMLNNFYQEYANHYGKQ